MRHAIAFLLCCSLLLAQTTSTPKAPAPGDKAAAEQQVRQAIDNWLAAEATADVAALDKLIAANFVGIGPGGNNITKEMIVPSEGRPAAFGGMKVTEATVRLTGDAAAVVGTMQGPDGGRMRFSLVYQRLLLGGGWQMLSAHLGPRVERE